MLLGEKMDNSAIDKAKKYASRILNLASYIKTEKDKAEMATFLIEAALNLGSNLSLGFQNEYNDDIFETFQKAFMWAEKSKFYLDVLLQNEVLSKKEHQSIASDCNELIAIIKELLRSIHEGV